jgi:HAD superfamily hydrolase (TIGR01509 family)
MRSQIRVPTDLSERVPVRNPPLRETGETAPVVVPPRHYRSHRVSAWDSSKASVWIPLSELAERQPSFLPLLFLLLLAAPFVFAAWRFFAKTRLCTSMAADPEGMHLMACEGAKEEAAAETSPLGRLAVIFDLDGTLCDSFQLGFGASNEVLRANGHAAVTPEDYHRGTRYTTPVRLAWHAGYEWDSEAFRAAGAKMGAEFDTFYVGLVTAESAPFYPRIRGLLSHLAAVCRLGALTNAAVAYAHLVLKANEVDSLFPVVHGADDVPAPKPHPDGLLQCCRELGVAPHEAVYIGDSPSDGDAARAAGMRSIGVTWGSHSPDTLAPNFDVVVSSVEELRAVLFPALRAGDFTTLAALSPSVAPPPVSRWLYLLDRDGVLNEDVGSPGVVSAEQLRLLPGAARAVAAINAAGHVVCVVTNQTCVQKGLISRSQLEEFHSALRCEMFAAEGAYFDDILVATGESENPLPLKPDPGMLLEAMRRTGIPASRTLFIGDAETDLRAAEAASCARPVLVTSSHHGQAAAQKVNETAAEVESYPDVFAAVDATLRRTA